MSVSGYYGQVRPLLGPGAFAHVFEKYRRASAVFAELSHPRPTDMLRAQVTTQLATEYGITRGTFLNADVAFWPGGDVDQANPMIRPAELPAYIPLVVLPRSYASQVPTGFWTPYAREPLSIAQSEPRARLAPELLLALQWEGDAGSPGEDYGLWFEPKDTPDWMKEPSKYGKILGDPDNAVSNGDEVLKLAANYSTIVTSNVNFAILGLLFRQTVVLLDRMQNRGVYDTWLANVPGCHWEGMPYE